MRVDGIDVRDLAPEVLWRRIGLVPQKPYLFTGTVASNLRYGDPDATDEQLWEALEIAQARDFVEAMPQGLETPIAQGGTNVSGGQRQRLCIARALVVKPEIYLFDDSFSALDLATDARLRAALRPHTRDATVVIVAQRVSTIIDADQIVVLEGGTIVGVGTHEELLDTCPTYLEIVAVPALREGGGVSTATPRRLPPGGARGHGPMAGMGMPAEKSMNFGPSARRLIGRMRPERARVLMVLVLAVVSVSLTVARPQDPRPGDRHHLRRRHRGPDAAAAGHHQGRRGRGDPRLRASPTSPTCWPGSTGRPAGASTSPRSGTCCCWPSPSTSRRRCSAGRRATCSTTSSSAPSSGCARTSRTSSTGCRCPTSTASRAASCSAGSPTTSTTSPRACSRR